MGRPPFPLPNVPVPFYFTIQPGGSYVKVSGGSVQGARLIYPNHARARAGTRFSFWNYDPDQKGWYVYGQGSVSADRKSIVPDPGVVLYQFTGAMVTTPDTPPPDGPNPNCPPSRKGCKNGEPVDLGTGLFVLTKTDLRLPGVMPIELTRTYRQGDNMSRVTFQRRCDLRPLSLAGQIIERVNLLQMVFPYFFDSAAQLFIFVRDRDDTQNLGERAVLSSSAMMSFLLSAMSLNDPFFAKFFHKLASDHTARRNLALR